MSLTTKRVYTPTAQRMLEGRPLPLLLRMASPNAIAFFVQVAVSMAEIGFVSRLGTASLAALALMFPGLMLMQMLANGAIGGAVSSAVARAIGADARDRAENLIWHALAIAVAAGTLFFAIFVLFGQSLLDVFGATADVSRAADDYATIVFAGATLIWTTALLSAVFRGMGNMKFPAALMVLGACVQVILAGTLTLGWFGLPAIGIKGPAIAVVAVAAMNGSILLVRLGLGRADLALRLEAFEFRKALFADIFRVGALASLSPVLTVVTTSSINALVSTFGVAALAGYGIVARLEFLLIPMVFGLGTAMTSMVGINVGAGKIDRAERIGWYGGLAAAMVTGIVGTVLAVAPGLWLGFFASDAATWASGESYLRIVGPVFAFQGLGLSLYFASQGAGTVTWPVLATLLRFAVGVGGAYAGVQWFDLGLSFVYGCLAAGMLLYGVMTAASIALGAWRQV